MKKSLFLLILTLLILLCSSAPIAYAEKLDNNSTASDIRNNLELWGSLFLTPWRGKNTISYVTINPNSLEHIDKNDKRYLELSVNVTTSTLTADDSNYKTYVFQFKGYDVWNSSTRSYVIAAKRTFRSWHYLVYDGASITYAYPTNPTLSLSLDAFYTPYDDQSGCPIEILAYYIEYGETQETFINFVIKNVFDKDIASYVGITNLLDSNGRPINGNKTYKFKSSRIIPANSAIIDTEYWTVEQGNQTKILKPLINRVIFKDNTMWLKQ